MKTTTQSPCLLHGRAWDPGVKATVFGVFSQEKRAQTQLEALRVQERKLVAAQARLQKQLLAKEKELQCVEQSRRR